jgi:small GTP-binding protein
MNTYKVIIVGPSGVGKSSMTHYLRHGKFVPALEPTVGAAFHKYSTRIHGVEINLDIWDTAGSPRYHSVLPMYMRESKAIILVYDVTNRESMYELETHWLKYLTMEIESLEKRNPYDTKVIKYLIANKIDLLEDLTDPLLLKGQNIANKNGYRFLVASARSGENVFTIFHEIATCLVENASLTPRKKDEKVTIEDITLENKYSCSC